METAQCILNRFYLLVYDGMWLSVFSLWRDGLDGSPVRTQDVSVSHLSGLAKSLVKPCNVLLDCIG